MAPQSTLISALKGKITRELLHVRVTRIWEATAKDSRSNFSVKQGAGQGRKVLNTKVIFIDEEATQIMVTIWNNQKQDYFPLLKEGAVYHISSFRVVPNLKEYRSVNMDTALSFYYKTKVLEVDDTGLIPSFQFQLTNFEDIRPLIWDTTNFIEIIGMVKEFGDPTTTSNGAKKMEILLVDTRNQEMVLNLWEEKAVQFLDGMAASAEGPAFVVVTGLLAKQYSGNTIVLSSGDPTRTYFNIDYTPLNEFRKNVNTEAEKKGTQLTPPCKKQFVNMSDKGLEKATIEEILEAEVERGQALRFQCEATIISVAEYAGWFYNSCPKCPKAIRIEDNKFYCDACTKGDWYRFTVAVQDESANTTFTLLNKDAHLLAGIPIESIVAELGQDKLTQDIPPVLNNIVGKRCAFEVKVTTYNQDGRAGYTVARVAEIQEPDPTTKQDTQAEEAGTSEGGGKKQKMA